MTYTAAEMAELREAVKELRGAIGVLAANVDPAQDKVLRLNVREARRSAAIRLQQLSPATLASPVRPRMLSQPLHYLGLPYICGV